MSLKQTTRLLPNSGSTTNLYWYKNFSKVNNASCTAVKLTIKCRYSLNF